MALFLLAVVGDALADRKRTGRITAIERNTAEAPIVRATRGALGPATTDEAIQQKAYVHFGLLSPATGRHGWIVQGWGVYVKSSIAARTSSLMADVISLDEAGLGPM
jgi:hypothetical protein